MSYAEDQFACRREIMLQYFGERFERKDCKRTCDNCKHAAQCERRDMTSLARGAMRIVRAKKITLAMLVDAVKGSSVQARRCCCGAQIFPRELRSSHR